MAPFERDTIWEQDGIAGARRFLERAWRLVEQVIASQPSAAERQPAEYELGADRVAGADRPTAASVTSRSDIEAMAFNTGVSTLMECLNSLTAYHAEHGRHTQPGRRPLATFVLLLAPFAPFIAEELWERLGGPYSVLSSRGRPGTRRRLPPKR